MTVITEEEFANLSKLADGIKDDTKRSNAHRLLKSMTEVIEGVGDRPITWQPKLVKVIQGTSKTDGISGAVKLGALVAGNAVIPNGTPVIALMTWISRSMWDPDQNSNRKLCSSPDGKMGYAHGNCFSCPFSQSKTEIPPCNKEQAFLMITADFSDMYRLTFHKTQYRDGKEWSDMIKNSRTHPYKRVYGLSGADSEKKKTVKTIKASLLDAKGGDLPEDELAFLEAMYHKQLQDRKAHLENYHEYVTKRLSEGGGSRIPAIEDNSSERLGFDAPATDGKSDESTPNYNL